MEVFMLRWRWLQWVYNTPNSGAVVVALERNLLECLEWYVKEGYGEL